MVSHWMATTAVGAGIVCGALGAGPLRAETSLFTENDTSLLNEVAKHLRTDYVGLPSDRQIAEACIRGAVQELDPNGSFFTRAEYDAQIQPPKHAQGAIGIAFARNDQRLVIREVYEGSPAERAGLKAGDQLVRINGKFVSTRLQTEAANLRGVPGTVVSLTVERATTGKTHTFVVKRAIIRSTPLTIKWLEPGVAYVRIRAFQARMWDKLNSIIKGTASDQSAPMKALILDLRDNTGGIFTEAVAVTDLFIQEGHLLRMVGPGRGSTNIHKASGKAPYPELALVVLVNGHTAAGAEVVVGALQDHKRATIVGSRTFGSDWITTLFPLSGGEAMTVTTSRWTTPDGRSVANVGITPDVLVEGDSRVSDAGEAAPVDTHLLKALEVARSGRSGNQKR